MYIGILWTMKYLLDLHRARLYIFQSFQMSSKNFWCDVRKITKILHDIQDCLSFENRRFNSPLTGAVAVSENYI